jgi:cytochrome c oxidase subunit III
MAHVVHESGEQEVFIQFEDIHQQNESYVVGMWTFLVTEVMFFGALFLIYSLYRSQMGMTFWVAHNELDIPMGAINTTILLASSFSVALAVHFMQIKKPPAALKALGFTLLCAFGFLIIKYFEWSHKWEVGHVPGPNFRWENSAAPAHEAEMFFSIYFAMTGLHAIHVIIGILVIGTLMLLIAKGHRLVKYDYIPTELVGLYWHFVDLVWIFLFPLFYLIPRPGP